MPILEIAATDGLAAPAILLGLFRVEAVMLWPAADDETARQEFLDAARMAWAMENVPAGVTFEAEDLRWLADAQPLAAVRERAKPRYYQGCLTGHIVCELLAVNDPAKNLTEAKQRAAAALRELVGRQRGWSDRPLAKVIDNDIWPQYKPSAHLWAAYIATMRGGGGSAFPCRADRSAAFLASADAMLQLGECFRAPHAPAALLDRETAWRVYPAAS